MEMSPVVLMCVAVECDSLLSQPSGAGGEGEGQDAKQEHTEGTGRGTAREQEGCASGRAARVLVGMLMSIILTLQGRGRGTREDNRTMKPKGTNRQHEVRKGEYCTG